MKQVRDADLSGRNSFRMKVRCALFVEVETEEELQRLDWSSLPRPLLVMGGGSNLLFTRDFPGTVLHVAIGGLRYCPESGEATLGAGVAFDAFCAWAAAEGLWGPENLSLIPGEAGAAAVQNIGAYGVEAKDLISGIRAYDRENGVFTDIDPADCAYGYRSSRFKGEWKGRYILTAVRFRLSRQPQPRLDYGGLREAVQPPLTPERIRQAVIGIRQQKLPAVEVLGSAGSFFCNPVVRRAHFERIEAIGRADNGPSCRVPHYAAGEDVKIPAAWLIEQCGFKGVRNGGAQVYPKQPLVIVNASGDATPEDVIGLERQIVRRVEEKYGITLHPEVEHV